MPGSLSSRYWPPADLVLSVDSLRLRPITEADLENLGDIMPADLEMNPGTPRPFGLPDATARVVAAHQEYWKALASWSPDAWELMFGVWVAGELAGTQTLEAHRFPVLRTVETASWLRTEQRGRGIGKLARTAVLALAFDGLGAQVALTEAWHDNPASLGVSRSLGYRDNGSVPRVRDEAAVEMPALRLDISGWRAVERPVVMVDGLQRCLRWFGAEAGSSDS